MLLSCGDALVDFLPVTSVDGRDAAVPVAGGSCLNIAVGMARLGAPAGFVGGISTDLFGRIIADHAREMADRCGRPIILENITSHLRLDGELSEPDFLKAVFTVGGSSAD